MARNDDYIGEYFMAVWTGMGATGYSYHILQLDPVRYLGRTETRELAIELVNRLDVTGDEQGDGEDEYESES